MGLYCDLLPPVCSLLTSDYLILPVFHVGLLGVEWGLSLITSLAYHMLCGCNMFSKNLLLAQHPRASARWQDVTPARCCGEGCWVAADTHGRAAYVVDEANIIL